MDNEVTSNNNVICKCKNEKCGQEFNSSNIHLAVCMYGAIFLIRPSDQDEPEGKGFFGFTCPVCLETSLYEYTVQQMLQVKENLDDLVHVKGCGGVLPELRYYSPFQLQNEVTKDFEIMYYSASSDDNRYFDDQFSDFRFYKFPESSQLFCSYIHDEDPPKGTFSSIYWYREEDIQPLLDLEKQNDIRIFPRYFYSNDTYDKIDPLLRFHFYQGKEYEQAKEDHIKEREATLEHLKKLAYDNDMNLDKLLDENKMNGPDITLQQIKQIQQRVKTETKFYSEFFDVLISDPYPIGSLWSVEDCTYLWSEPNYFKGKTYPDYFASTVDTRSTDVDTMLEDHRKWVNLVRENQFKQYVQEHLQSDLPKFLEKYQELLCSRAFSYADVWELKQRHLERLHGATIKGLSAEALYVMKQEGESWRIVFNGEARGGLKGGGFDYIYHLLCYPNRDFYHWELASSGGDFRPPEMVDIPKAIKKMEKEDKKDKEYDKKVKVGQKELKINTEPVMPWDDLIGYFKKAEKLKEHIAYAKEIENERQIDFLEGELLALNKFIHEGYDPKTKKQKYVQNADTKKAINSVGNAIRRALEKMNDDGSRTKKKKKKKKKEDTPLYQHFAKALDHEHLYTGTLSYRPDPDSKIEWITQ